MSLVSRVFYLAALIGVAALYIAILPPESYGMGSMLHYMIPATSIGILFILANGVMGNGISTYIGSIILVVGVIALVSVSLPSTGLVTGVREVAGIITNFTNSTNATIPLGILP